MSSVKIKYTADTTGVDSANKKVESSFSGLKKAAAGIAVPVAAIGGTLAALSIGGLVKGIKDLADYAGGLSDLAAMSDMTAGRVAILSRAFESSGVSGTAFTKIISGLSNKLEDPSKSTLEWLEKFGLSVADIENMNPEERFTAIGNGIAGLSSHTQKLKASADFFGKVGASLLVMFKSPDAIKNAEKYVGSLADTMTKTADDLDAFSDSLGGMDYKVRQFFAGIASNNIGIFKDLTTTIDNLDLGPLGAKFGEVADKFVQAFKNDELGSAIGNSLMIGIKSIYSELAAVFTTLGEMVGEGIASILKGYLPKNPLPEGVLEVGGKLLQRGVSNMTAGLVSPDFFSGNAPVIDDPIAAYKRNLEKFKGLSFLDDSENREKFNKAGENRNKVEIDQKPHAWTADNWQPLFDMQQKEALKAWQNKNWQPSFDMFNSASTTDIPSYLKKGDIKATAAEARLQPIISSLASIGGGNIGGGNIGGGNIGGGNIGGGNIGGGNITGGLKNNPLVSLHKTTNKLLNQVVKNTSNIGNGSASFA